jgi:tRNA A-37 threonylcarbamoyl transferase component Bud32
MAELTLAVKYKPLTTAAVVKFCLLWVLLELVAIACFIAHPELNALIKLALVLIGAGIVAYPPFVVVSFYREGGSLIATADGLVLPPGYWGFGNTTSVKWKDVTAVDVFTSGERREILCLGTSAGPPVKIEMAGIPDSDREKLFLAMEVWLPGRLWSEAAIAQKERRQISAGDASFSQLWDAELQRRYSATTFVPRDPGTKIGDDLTVARQIAFGGFSAIYLAETGKKEKVVVKELVVQTGEADLQAKALELFDREARLLAKLNHPQIARVYDHFVREGSTFIVLQQIEGENLREYVRRRGPCREDFVWEAAQQMTSILAYLHELPTPIIHRDFTPENLVLGSDGRLTLIDFGAANEYTSRATGTLIGKQAYMPVEQIRGKAEPRSDLYALGGVLYWLLTGREPEPLKESHPRLADGSISEDMDIMVAKLTALEAEERFSSARALSEYFRTRALKVGVPENGG